MKKVTTILAAILLMAVGAAAQKLSYQAVVRNSSNELVPNTALTVEVSILDAVGAVQYAETHSATTNQNGLLVLTIGDGTVTAGTTVADVNWNGAAIQSVVKNGSIVVATITSPVNAVPYALQAGNVSAMSVADLLALVGSMTDAEKEQLRDALGVTGGGSDPATFVCGTSKMVDADGNEYETVQIGTQCWTKTNLRSTKDRNGNLFINGMTAALGSYTEEVDSVVYIPTDAAWNENNSSVTYDEGTFGYYYNWPAAMLVCPAGWHLPSDAEWTLLENYVSNAQEGTEYIYRCDQSDATSIAKALASETDVWNSYAGECYPGDQSEKSNNATGFSTVPAGSCSGSSFYYAGYAAYFWSATQHASSPTDAYYRNLYSNDASVLRFSNYKAYGRSVRCLRDAEE